MENKLSNHHSEQFSEHFHLISPPETDTYGFPQSHGQAIICALRLSMVLVPGKTIKVAHTTKSQQVWITNSPKCQIMWSKKCEVHLWFVIVFKLATNLPGEFENSTCELLKLFLKSLTCNKTERSHLIKHINEGSGLIVCFKPRRNYGILET